MEKERITYLDSLKGLLIILIMLLHSSLPPIYSSLISVFYLQTFFMLSGMFCKPLTSGDTKNMIRKYSTVYLRPYYITSVVCVIITQLYGSLFHNGFILYADSLKNIFLLSIGYTRPIWFLVALFCGLIVYKILSKLFGGITLFLVITSISIFSTQHLFSYDYYLPLCFKQGLFSVIFIYMGNMLRLHLSLVQKVFNNLITYIIIVVLYVYNLICKGNIAIYELSFSLGYIDVIISIIISSFIICKSKYIDCKPLNYIGKHTLLILCVHSILFNFICKNPNLTTLEQVGLNIVPVLVIAYIIVKIKGYIAKKTNV